MVFIGTGSFEQGPNARLDTLIAGDQINGTLNPYYEIAVEANTSGSFDETLTYQLQYIRNPRR